MIIGNVEYLIDSMEIINLLRADLAMHNIQFLQKEPRESGNNIQIQCPYHGNGQERKPSAGILKSDGTFHCFRGDTKVITKEYGSVRMDSIVDIPVHILNGKGLWEQVAFRDYGKQPLMKLTLTCNTKTKIIYATPEHEWLVKYTNKKRQTQNLISGMYLQKCVPHNSTSYNLDPLGIVHGFCYGDGNNYGHCDNTSKWYHRCYFYNDSDLELIKYFECVGAEFKEGFAGNGKKYKYAIIHSDRNFKELPSLYENDDYLMSFLAGYFVADGNCHKNKLTIYSHKYDDLYKVQQICNTLGIMSTEIGVSNISKGKRGCIDVKKDTHGYTLRLARNTIPDNFFITNKGRSSYQKYTGRNAYKVVSVEPTDLFESVYCCQTSTHSFALEHFILTGNCFACGETHSLPEVISHCFGYDDNGHYGKIWLETNIPDKHYIFNMSDSSKEGDARLIGKLKKKAKEKDSKKQYNKIGNLIDADYVSEEELDSYRWTHPYWAKRGIVDEKIIELFDLGYDREKQCITFPVRDIQGKCEFVAKRSVNTKFFQYPSGVSKPLYGLYELYNTIFISGSRKSPSIMLCESMIDCILLWQSGHRALALNGLGNDRQFIQLRNLDVNHIILATDNDKAGQEARKRIRKNVTNKIFSEIVFPENRKDIGECSREEIDNILQWEKWGLTYGKVSYT